MQRPAKGEVAHISGRLIGPRLRIMAYFHNYHTFSLELGPLNVHPVEEILLFRFHRRRMLFLRNVVESVAAVCLAATWDVMANLNCVAYFFPVQQLIASDPSSGPNQRVRTCVLAVVDGNGIGSWSVHSITPHTTLTPSTRHSS